MTAVLLLLAVVKDCLTTETQQFVRVDFVVINRVRTFDTEYDGWGRPRVVPRESVWISFWDHLRVTVLPGPGPLVARGWWTASNLRNMVPCTDGWLLESNDGVNVVTSEIRFINSPFDWELRHRRIFRPIQKP